MKFKRSITALGSAAIVAGSVALMMLGASTAVHAGIKNTKHNLGTTDAPTGRRLSFDTTEICVFCHTPHMSVAKDSGIPLWNHMVSTVANYGLYSSDTFNGSANQADIGTGNPADATANDALAAVAVSNLCLSCHDGTVAVNALYNASNLDGDTDPGLVDCVGCDAGKFGDWNSNIGTDLSNDHPVNFSMQDSYNEEINLVGGGSLYDPATLGGVRFFGANYMLQCPSCHDPHIDYSAAGNTAQTPFLRVAITGSELCLTCHNK